MGNLKVFLPSGAVLEATLSSFQEGHRLFKSVTKELESLDMKEDTVQKMAFKLIHSEAVEVNLWACMGRATYNTRKINPELFENEDIRADFILVAKEVLVFNLTPFFKNLGLAFLDLNLKNIESQK